MSASPFTPEQEARIREIYHEERLNAWEPLFLGLDLGGTDDTSAPPATGVEGPKDRPERGRP